MIYFPNTRRVLDSWIITAGDFFDSGIINDEIPIDDMPPVQQTSLDASIEKLILTMIQNLKSDIIVDVMEKLGDTVKNCNIPSKESLENATKENPVAWDPVANYAHSENQPISSFNEQKLAIEEY